MCNRYGGDVVCLSISGFVHGFGIIKLWTPDNYLAAIEIESHATGAQSAAITVIFIEGAFGNS
jgi:hypothetical protein